MAQALLKPIVSVACLRLALPAYQSVYFTLSISHPQAQPSNQGKRCQCTLYVCQEVQQLCKKRNLTDHIEGFVKLGASNQSSRLLTDL